MQPMLRIWMTELWQCIVKLALFWENIEVGKFLKLSKYFPHWAAGNK